MIFCFWYCSENEHKCAFIKHVLLFLGLRVEALVIDAERLVAVAGACQECVE